MSLEEDSRVCPRCDEGELILTKRKTGHSFNKCFLCGFILVGLNKPVKKRRGFW